MHGQIGTGTTSSLTGLNTGAGLFFEDLYMRNNIIESAGLIYRIPGSNTIGVWDSDNNWLYTDTINLLQRNSVSYTGENDIFEQFKVINNKK